MVLRGVYGMAAVALWFSDTPTPVGAAGLLAPASDLRFVALRGFDGMAAVALWFSDTPTPVRAAGQLAPALDLLFVALRCVDGMTAVAPKMTPRSSRALAACFLR